MRSFVTSVTNGARVPAGRAYEIKGIAFDGGSGIGAVDISVDGGRTWRSATLGQDLGRFSFREWRSTVTFAAPGAGEILVRASNRDGQVQPMEATWNASGYRRNVVERTSVVIA